MPGRNYTASGVGKYRFGFNGKEKDDEVKGDGNQQDYGMRFFDSRLGKFLSVDPLTKNYSWYSPYQFAGNKPVISIDVDGNEEFIVTIKPINSESNCQIELVNVFKLDPNERVEAAGMGTGGVEYRYYNSDGTFLSSERIQDFKPGTAESEYLNQTVTYYTDAKCQSPSISALRKDAMVPVTGGNVGPENNDVTGIPVDKIDGTPNPESSKFITPGIRDTKYKGLANISLDIKFKSDKTKISESDLSNYSSAMNSINEVVNFLNEKKSRTNNKKIIVTGGADVSPSRYKNGCGNRCLAEDRSKNLASKLRSMLPAGVNIESRGSTNTSSTVKNEDRRASAIIIPAR